MTEDNEILGHYYFLPWVREGLATLIDDVLDDVTVCASGQRVSVNIEIQPTGHNGAGSDTSSPIPRTVEMYGPGDIIGFSDTVITRCEPKKDVGDFEPNYFPFLEFEQHDFPWRFTACKPDENRRLTPWITLIVLIAEGDNKEFEEGPASSFPDARSPFITKTDLASLPDLGEAWRWAHLQMTAEARFSGSDQENKLKDLIRNDPSSVVSQLMCARRLRTGTLYQAFVVPSFKLGVLAGLGLELSSDISASVPAWEHEGFNPGDELYYTESGIALPYYYTWQFRTGLRGDFEALVRRLEPRKLTGLGIKDVDCTNPGYDVKRDAPDGELEPVPLVLGLEGALMSLDREPTSWGHDVPGWTDETPVNSFQKSLQMLVNQPRADIEEGTVIPKIVPPIYGRWHAARKEVIPTNDSWLDTLNLDPRHRMVAAFGTNVVQKQQEQLMASAWDQIGPVDEANEILNRAQMGREASISIHKERLGRMSASELIRVTSPVHNQIRFNPSRTISAYLKDSRIPSAALDPAFYRIGRRRGPLRKRQKRTDNTPSQDILERLNNGSLSAAGRHPDPDGALSVCGMTFRLLQKYKILKATKKLYPEVDIKDKEEIVEALNLFCPANITCETIKKLPGRPDFTGNIKDLDSHGPPEGENNKKAAHFWDALLAVCEKLEPEEKIEEGYSIDLEDIRKLLLEELKPEKTITARIWQRLRFLNKHERKQDADPLDQIMAAPEFDWPMYEPLQAISQDLLLPGLETVPQNTLALLKTNSRFVESYMVGLNHEMARELRWREYPTDQRGSYFRQFWDVSNYIPKEDELETLLEEYFNEKPVDSVADLTDDEKRLILLRHEKLTGDVSELSEEDLNTLIEELLTEDLLEDKLRDIKKIHSWEKNKLGNNDSRKIPTGEEDEKVVLIIRGDLLRKYPNTMIYAVEGRWITDKQGQPKRVPTLPEHYPDDNSLVDISEEEWPGDIKNPIFSGQLPPDVTFLGFDIKDSMAKGNMNPTDNSAGWYFVIEERVSESRFGMDMATAPETSDPADWNAISWGHIQDLWNTDTETGEELLMDDVYLNASAPTLPNAEISWEDSSASIAWITIQKPVRIAVHACKMIPDRPEE